jgi:UDP-N-acetylmuramoyl-tripeptide--D-alanyl-D-alanine ligase
MESLYQLFLDAWRVCTDSRQVQKGDLFFALQGENFDGNAFAFEALKKGAHAVVIDNPEYFTKPGETFLVDDVLEALQQLATYHRDKLKIPIIAITGSNGKTTTKELLTAVLQEKYKVCATRGNLNNHIGVPLTLLSIKATHEIAVVEMGANHVGEIGFLCDIAKPNYGIITNIGKAHLEGFGGFEGVKRAKSELYRYLEAHQGTAFISQKDEVLQALKGNVAEIATHSLDFDAKVVENFPYLQFSYHDKDYESPVVATHLVGAYNIDNLLYAIAVGNFFQVPAMDIEKAISGYVPKNNRSQLELTAKENHVVVDCYNANPSSMANALENFANIRASNKFFILGDMLELGDESIDEHLAIFYRIQELGLRGMYVGLIFAESLRGKTATCFHDKKHAEIYLRGLQLQNHWILLKGSRGIYLEEFLPLL